MFHFSQASSFVLMVLFLGIRLDSVLWHPHPYHHEPKHIGVYIGGSTEGFRTLGMERTHVPRELAWKSSTRLAKRLQLQKEIHSDLTGQVSLPFLVPWPILTFPSFQCPSTIYHVILLERPKHASTVVSIKGSRTKWGCAEVVDAVNATYRGTAEPTAT